MRPAAASSSQWDCNIARQQPNCHPFDHLGRGEHTILMSMMRAWTSPDWYWALEPAPAALVMPTMAEPAAARVLMRTILT